jgi:hypothetical protein
MLNIASIWFLSMRHIKQNKIVETQDIVFSRCSCDSSIYCLTDEQYIVIIAQLSSRENIIKGD